MQGLFLRPPLRRLILLPSLTVVMLLAAATTVAYEAEPPQGVDLSGDWVLNVELSDDPASKDPRLRKRHWWQHDETEASRNTAAPQPRQDGLYGPTTLRIRQTGRHIEMLSENETRRFDAGSESTVSTSGGGLADSRVGWDRKSFVVDRRVPRGPRLLETYRLLTATDQLEVKLRWSGRESPLAGTKLRRIYDRTHIDATPGSVEGPVPDFGGRPQARPDG